MGASLTVIMPVYNCEKFLAEAIESILNQTYSNFELHIINDGSTDQSQRVIDLYKDRDARIMAFTQSNQGLINTLNKAMNSVTTKYIARMDGDDVAHPKRLETQLNYLEANPTISLVGTSVKYCNESLDQTLEIAHFPTSHNVILWKMLHTTGIAHATIVIRTESFKASKGYNADALYVEDYDFFVTNKDHLKYANLQKVLYTYRKQSESVSQKYSFQQKLNHDALFKQYMQSITESPISDTVVAFLRTHKVKETSDFPIVYSSLNKLYQGFTSHLLITKREGATIRKDFFRILSILALTYKNRLFWPGIFMYFRVVFQSPSILFFNLKNRVNV